MRRVESAPAGSVENHRSPPTPVPPVRPTAAQHVAQLGKRMVFGMALTAPTALVASQTATPLLLRTLGHALPVGQGILSSFGGVTAGACLGLSSMAALALAIGLMKIPYFKQTGMLGWVLTHILAGITLSPWLLTGVTLATSPVFIFMGGCWLGIGILLGQSAIGQKPSSMNIGRMCLLAALMGPLAWQVALGANIAHLMIYSLTLASVGSYLWTVATAALPLHFILTQQNTAYVERFIVPDKRVRQYRFPLDTENSANVFNVSPTLKELVTKWQQEPFNWPPIQNLEELVHVVEPAVVMLSGPPGTGKTVTALAIANALDATLIAPTAGVLLSDDIPTFPLVVSNVFTVLAQAYFYQRRTKKRVVVFFDEIDSLLNVPAIGQEFAGLKDMMRSILRMDRALMVAYLGCLLAGGKIVVVGATNQLNKIKTSNMHPKFREYLTQVNITMSQPSPEQLQHIWEKEIQLAWAKAVKLGVPHVDSVVDTCELAEWTQRAYDAGYTGRNLKAVVQTAQNGWIADQEKLLGFSDVERQAHMKQELKNTFEKSLQNFPKEPHQIWSDSDDKFEQSTPVLLDSDDESDQLSPAVPEPAKNDIQTIFDSLLSRTNINGICKEYMQTQQLDIGRSVNVQRAWQRYYDAYDGLFYKSVHNVASLLESKFGC